MRQLSRKWGTTNLAVGDDDQLRLARVVCFGSSIVELRNNVGSGDLCMLGGLRSLLLLLPIDHITNRVNIGMRLDLERVLDLDLSAWCEDIRTERLHEASSRAITIGGNL